MAKIIFTHDFGFLKSCPLNLLDMQSMIIESKDILRELLLEPIMVPALIVKCEDEEISEINMAAINKMLFFHKCDLLIAHKQLQNYFIQADYVCWADPSNPNVKDEIVAHIKTRITGMPNIAAAPQNLGSEDQLAKLFGGLLGNFKNNTGDSSHYAWGSDTDSATDSHHYAWGSDTDSDTDNWVI
jgi:hypothetical protein